MRVSLIVYDLHEIFNVSHADLLGIGLYHTGVCFDDEDIEFAFGGDTDPNSSGVYGIIPKTHTKFHYKTTIELGDLDPNDFATAREANSKDVKWIRDLRPII